MRGDLTAICWLMGLVLLGCRAEHGSGSAAAPSGSARHQADGSHQTDAGKADASHQADAGKAESQAQPAAAVGAGAAAGPRAQWGETGSKGKQQDVSRENAAGRYVPLAVPDGYPALLWVPAGSSRIDVMFVAHGAGGAAEHHCDYWRALTQERMLLVCLRGTPLYRSDPDRGWYYPDHHQLEDELLNAVSALREAHGDRLSEDGWTYAGYSQGATMGALMVVDHGDLFSRLVFIEGGVQGWTRARASRFLDAGGGRVLFVCGRESCAQEARRGADVLGLAGGDARARHVPGGGHTYLGGVGEEVVLNLPWLFAPLLAEQ